MASACTPTLSRIVIAGVLIMAALASPARAASYENRYVHGQLFFIGTEGALQAWVSVSKGSDLQVTLCFVNGTDQSITFAPQSVQVDAIKQQKGTTQRVRLRTYGAAEYEKKVRTAQAWGAALYTFSAVMANQPQPQTSHVSGNYSGSDPSGSFHGNYSGTITTSPTADDYAAANARSQAQAEAMTSQLNASFAAMQATLLRTHTLLPHSYVSGIVHVKKAPADAYEMVVPFGGEEFRFSFHFEK